MNKQELAKIVHQQLEDKNVYESFINAMEGNQEEFIQVLKEVHENKYKGWENAEAIAKRIAEAMKEKVEEIKKVDINEKIAAAYEEEPELADEFHAEFSDGKLKVVEPDSKETLELDYGHIAALTVAEGMDIAERFRKFTPDEIVLILQLLINQDAENAEGGCYLILAGYVIHNLENEYEYAYTEELKEKIKAIDHPYFPTEGIELLLKGM